MMERTILLILVAAIIGAGVFAGVVGFVTGANSQPQASDYVLVSGDCWVHPQGDPLYDEHYAKNVNPQNCTSYKTQEQANQTKAITRRINVDTTQGITLVYALFGMVGVMLGLIVFSTIRG